MYMVSSGQLRLCKIQKQTIRVTYFLTQFQQCRVNMYFLLIIHTLNTAHVDGAVLGDELVLFKCGEVVCA